MIQVVIKTNLSEVLQKKKDQIDALSSSVGLQEISRVIAVSLLPVIHDRIHVQGRAADGSQIGLYSQGYMKTRQRLNRGPDRKVILSLRRQMENDMSVVAASEKSYGIGFKNAENYRKSQYVENTYKKPIYSLTQDERSLILPIAEKHIHDALSV